MSLKSLKNAGKLKNLALLALVATLISGCVVKEPSHHGCRQDAPRHHHDRAPHHHR